MRQKSNAENKLPNYAFHRTRKSGAPVKAALYSGMSVDDPKVIDIIHSEKEGGSVTLTVTDHLEWGDGEHLIKLQEKLDSYLAFIESGEIFEQYPGATGKVIKLNVVCKYRPDPEGEKFLSLCREVIAKAGFEFSHEAHGI